MVAHYAEAWRDIVHGVTAVPIWGRLGWQEVKRRYRRTVFGPFWSTLSLAIFICSLGFVWANLWGQDPSTYLPFLSGGLLAWTLVSAFITDGCAVFTANEGLLKQLKISLTALCCAVVWRNIIVFFHNLIILALVDVAFGVAPHWQLLLVVPGLAILAINGIWFCILLGLVCSRYRDLSQLVTSFIQIILFVTPIFWLPTQLKGRLSMFVDYNVVYHYVDLVRAPLLGTAPETWSYVVAGAATLVGWAVTFAVFARFRHRLAYWL